MSNCCFRWSAVLILAVVTAYAGGRVVTAQDLPFDLLIINGRIMDGTGNPWRRADIGVRDGRIAAIGVLGDASAERRIDAGGQLVTPGFIDVHSHAGEGLAREGLGQGKPLLAQGITTIVANPDGGGPVDLNQQRQLLESNGLGLNVALLIGHAAVRRDVLAMADRTPTEEEMVEMQRLVRRGMKAGAYGLSSGLFYAPGSYATTEEIVALGSVVAEFGGLYTSHIRDESNYTVGLVAAVNEVIEIAEANGMLG
ncbi:MAG: amidohydrolase family protein, partial [Acidobacteriota bacterium]|nr:amidohydrolase family protein [Acidobacteriota bacterium]